MSQEQEQITTRRERLAREKTLYLYTVALENGDIEALTSIWQQTMHNSVLETMLLDIHMAYEQEVDPGVPLIALEAKDGAGTLNGLNEVTAPPFTRPERRGRRATPRQRFASFALKLVAVLLVGVLIGSFWLLIASHQPAAKGPAGAGTATVNNSVTPIVIIPSADEKGTLIALRPQNGKQIWSKTIGHPLWEAPIAVQGQTVYVVSSDGHVYALRLTDGTVLWQQTISSNSYNSHCPTRIKGSSLRLFTSHDFITIGCTQISLSGYEAFIAVLQATNGKVRWTSQVFWQADATPVLGMDGDTIYLTDGKVTKAIKAENQALLWQTSKHSFLPANDRGTGSLVTLNGVLYGYSTAGLQALDAKDGHLIWLQPAARDGALPGMLVGGNNRLFLATANQFCAYGMDTGKQLWCTHAKTSGNVFEEFEGLVYMDGIVYVGRGMFNASIEFQIEAWDGASGKQLWKWPSQALLSHDRSWTFSGGQGVLYIPGKINGLYAVRGKDGHQLWFDPSFKVGSYGPAVAQ